MANYKSPFPLPDEHMRLVGIISAHWEYVEMLLERAIAEIMEHDWNRIRLLTANIGFRTKCELILLHARPFEKTDKATWKQFTTTLNVIKAAYTQRNKYVHARWRIDANGGAASIQTIRTKGGNLIAEEVPAPIDDLIAAAQQIDAAANDLIRLLQQRGVLLP